MEIVGSDHVLSASDDLTVAVSAVHSTQVLKRFRTGFDPHGVHVLPDTSIAVMRNDLSEAAADMRIYASQQRDGFPPGAAALLLQNHAAAKKVRILSRNS